MKTTLHLNLRRKYFEEIAAGTKRVEYREQKPYWRKRLEHRKYDVIKFRNGYAPDKTTISTNNDGSA
jgi:ASC-1-like (ASCH) protein